MTERLETFIKASPWVLEVANLGIRVAPGETVTKEKAEAISLASRKDQVIQNILNGHSYTIRGIVRPGETLLAETKEIPGGMEVVCACRTYGFILSHIDMAICPNCQRIYVLGINHLVAEPPPGPALTE